ncbi:dUTP diphosphatase, partial [Salmonella enterica]|uniref:dUTP diphosphatase n=1 Tax=Salmonella enterica TaxID=28901 RepID=UPI0034DD6204
ATKFGVRPGNCTGVADEDYTGEYIVALHNDSCDIVSIKEGDRIAQLVFLPYIGVEFKEVDELDKTDRGDGGFGSTGK